MESQNDISFSVFGPFNKTCFPLPPSIQASLHLYLQAASKKQRVRFSNIMEVRQLPSTQALEAKLSRMSYPAAKDHEAMLRTVGKLTITDVAKISFFFCFVVSKSSVFEFTLLHQIIDMVVCWIFNCCSIIKGEFFFYYFSNKSHLARK